MIKKTIICIIITLTIMQISYSITDTSKFDYGGFIQKEELQTYKVSYIIQEQNYKFEMQYYYNDILINTCERDGQLNEGDIFNKVTCDIEKKGDGNYEFKAKLINKNTNEEYELTNKEYIYQKTQANIQFTDFKDKTQITINIQGEGKNLVIENNIPKTVIEKLNKQNKDQLITSTNNYEILEEDPLIAWNVDKAPTQINYTINKKLSQEQKNNFAVGITQKSSFKILKIILGILIIVILIFVFKPIFKKNAK